MPSAEAARLIASLELQDKFTPGVNKALGGLGKLDAGIARTSNRAYKAGTQIGTGIKNGALIAAGAIGFLATQATFGFRSLAALEEATAATDAALKSTKSVAGQTGASIRALAEKYENLNAVIDDKVIQSGENVLLTFTNIRKDAFEPALKAALDLSVGMKQDLQTSVVQLGKALNDPIKGLTSLQRIGVAFTADQKKQIADLVKHNDLLGAQRIILDELGKEFGGRFAAQGKTANGAIAGIGDAVEDLQKDLALGLFPIVQKVLPKIREGLADPRVTQAVTDLGKSIAGLFTDANLKAGADFLEGAFNTAKEAAPLVSAAAKTTFGFVQAAVSLFKSLPKEVQALAIGGFAVNKLTGGLVTNIAGGIIDTVGKQFLQRGGTPANPLFVADVTGGGAAAGLAGAVGGAGKTGKALALVGKTFLVGAAVGTFAELKGILDDQSQKNREAEQALAAKTQGFTKVAGIDDLKTALAGIEAQEKHLENTWDAQGFAFRANIDGVKDAVHEQEATLRNAIATAEGKLAANQVHISERSDAIAASKSEAVRRATEAASMNVRRVEAAENRASAAIRARIDAAARAQTYAARAQIEAIKDKDNTPKVTVHGSPITVNVRTTVADQISSQTTFKKAGNVYAL